MCPDIFIAHIFIGLACNATHGAAKLPLVCSASIAPLPYVSLVQLHSSSTPYCRGEAVATGEIVGSGLLTSFAGLASWALWFYGQRYIGELSLVYLPAEQLQPIVDVADQAASSSTEEQLPAAPGSEAPGDAEAPLAPHWTSDPELAMCLQFSTLDFWGKRQVRGWMPPELMCTACAAVLVLQRIVTCSQ